MTSIPANNAGADHRAVTEMPPRLRHDVSIRPFDVLSGPPRYIVAVDDRHFVVNDAVAALLEATREETTIETIAQRVSGLLGRCVTPAQAETALRERIPGVVFHKGAAPATSATGPLLWQRRLLTAETILPVLRATSRLFDPERVATLLMAFATVDVLIAAQLWQSGMHAVAGASVPGVFVLVMLGVLIHELGHLSACHRYGARHGGIGIGLYWFLPAFYAEVHGAWMLSRRQRAVVDIGGIYFQCLFLLLLAALHFWRPSPTYLMALMCSHFLLLNTLNPVLKFDGYWLLSDLSGSHNLHRRIREAVRLCCLRVLRAGTAPAPSGRELLLLGLFVTLAVAYFGYVIFFIAHNLAYVMSCLVSAWPDAGFQPAPWWELVLRASTLALLAVISLGIAFMLARAIKEATSASPLEKSDGNDHPRVTDVVA